MGDLPRPASYASMGGNGAFSSHTSESHCAEFHLETMVLQLRSAQASLSPKQQTSGSRPEKRIACDCHYDIPEST